MALIRATPPPGTMPSSTAARVADRASSTRCFLFLQLSLGCCANTDDGNATGQFSQAFLQFFAIVIAGALVNLNPDLLNATLDLAVITFATNNGGVILIVTTTFSALPRSATVVLSSLRPVSSAMTVAPVRMAISCSIALRRSPKPGALTPSNIEHTA